MNEFRISKYNPAYRVDGIYTRNEWSSCFDVGKVFEDGELTEQECCETIDRYIRCALELLKTAGVGPMKISGLEVGGERIPWRNGQIVDLNELPAVIRDCLCKACWYRLNAENAFVHFGYELYLYIGCDLTWNETEAIALNCGLFAERRESPYKETE